MIISRIFDDRIEIWNPGRLPEGWSVETLKQKHESKPFNPLLAKMFFLGGYRNKITYNFVIRGNFNKILTHRRMGSRNYRYDRGYYRSRSSRTRV